MGVEAFVRKIVYNTIYKIMRLKDEVEPTINNNIHPNFAPKRKYLGIVYDRQHISNKKREVHAAHTDDCSYLFNSYG